MDPAQRVDADRQILHNAQQSGPLALLLAYLRLSGPGWLQGALVLGGGSLTSSLYLGVLGGLSLLWIQPLAMLLGVVMMSAISYAALSIEERPFRAINKHINPVLGWSWVVAALLANMVWSMSQYSICFAICEQNFFPSWFAAGAVFDSTTGAGELGKWVVSLAILTGCTCVTWSYGSGHWGIKLYDGILKLAVALIVVAFLALVLRMAWSGDGLDLGAILSGLIPSPKQFYQPSPALTPWLDAIADPAARQYWSDLIVSEQRDVMISAGSAAVGINALFMLPYLLLNRGWDKTFRGMSIFDLFTGTCLPFVLTTGCIVVAASAQFHGELPEGFVVTDTGVEAPPRIEQAYESLLAKRRAAVANVSALPAEPDRAEQKMAGVLVRRDTYDLAQSLERLFRGNDETEASGTGRFLANTVFGGGVIAMTVSSISLMMLISGIVVCEVLDRPATGWPFRLGCLISGVGVLWPLLWQADTRAWLGVIAGVYGAMLLPIAYIIFGVMMNQRSLLRDAMPRGMSRVIWNTAMAIAIVAATAAGISAVWKKAGLIGLGFVAVYVAVVLAVQVARRGRAPA